MKNNITTFIFDCFGVVCDSILSNWYRYKSLKHGFVDENLKDVFRNFDLGILSEEDLADYFSKYEGIKSTKEEIQKEIDGYLKVNQNLVNTIKKLKSHGFKTVLLSNGNHSFFERKIFKDYPEFPGLFDEVVISSKIGLVKPDAEIYLHALEKINSKPKESLFIDDRQINVDGAISIGMKGYVYSDSTSFYKYLKNMGINLTD